MAAVVPPGGTSIKVERFRGSLARSVLFFLLLLALLPAAVLAGVNYFRSRQLLHDQTSAQLETIIHSQSQTLNQLANQSQAGLAQLFSREDILLSLQVLNQKPNDPAAVQNSQVLLKSFISDYQSISGTSLSQILVLSKTGKILVSTNPQWDGQNLAPQGPLSGLIGSEKTLVSYDVAPLFTGKWMLFTSKPMIQIYSTNTDTVVGAIQSPVFEQVLQSTDSIYPTGKAYYFTKSQIFQYLQSIEDMHPLDPDQDHLRQLLGLVTKGESLGSITSTFGMPVLAYASWLPQLDLGFVVEEPDASIYNLIDSQIPTNIGLILIIFLIIGVFVYFSSMQVVRPLRQLAGLAKEFASGDWTKRAPVKRSDEIGLLANSFNQMAVQISGLYSALETKVEERAKQIRSASEFTQIAVASNSLEDIFIKTLDLFVNQFGFTFASIFLLDETGNYLILQDSLSSSTDEKPAHGYRIPIGANTLISWVALNNHSRVVPNIPEETFYHVELLLQGSLSEAVVPISLGNNILGVIEIQSQVVNGFDPEIIATFVTLANQVASGIQNIRLRESAQINLAENSLLYRTSRQVAEAKENQEVIDILVNTLKQTSYVSGIYSVEEDHLELIALNDPKNLEAFRSIRGITIALQKVYKRLSEENLILIDNLNQFSDFTNLVAYFARAGCHSAALIAIHEGVRFTNIIVLGSRESLPLTSIVLQPFSNLVEVVNSTLERLNISQDLQQTMKALDQEKFLLNAWLANTADFVYFKDSEGKYMRVSKAYANHLGIDQPDLLIGKVDVESQISEQDQLALQEDQEIIQSNSPKLRVIKKNTDSDGVEIWTLNNKFPLLDQNGQPMGIFATASDISESMKSEQLSRQRSQQIRTAAEIARDSASTLQVDDLLQKSVNMIRDRFGFYHASIFLLDALNEFAILRESTGEAGARMKAANHKLAVGSKSIVGQSTQRCEPVVVNDVTQDNTYYPNPLLPDTRSELAIPLMVGSKVVGALDVQSTLTNAFLPEDIQTLQILADQLAIAVYNGNLFAQAQENLIEHRLLHQITTAATSAISLDEALATTVSGLQTALGGDHVAIFFPSGSDELIVRASAGYKDIDLTNRQFKFGEGAIGLAASEKRPILITNALTDSRYTAIDADTRSQLAVPILYSDTLLGVLNIEKPQPAGYDENDQEILGALGNSLGAIISNARLLEEIRKQVDRQRQLYEITGKLRRSPDIHSILETSAIEISKVVHAARAHIEILTDTTVSPELTTRPNGKEVLE
ncbi:MAG: GAF domain-containing protein [Anaerolineaceae bacterium]|nr:GAF domain-containing protein [Anaerolineaceae bacterium]